MLTIFTLLLIGGLLLLSCFIYFRIRRSNEKNRDEKLPAEEISSPHGRAKLVIKNGDSIIIKTTGIADDKMFFLITKVFFFITINSGLQL